MKKIFYILSIIILLLVINSLGRSIYDLWGRRDIVRQAERNLDKEKAKNEELKRQLKIAKTPEFIENEARTKLFLSKPGEKEIILPAPSQTPSETSKKETPNWQKWFNLFN